MLEYLRPFKLECPLLYNSKNEFVPWQPKYKDIEGGMSESMLEKQLKHKGLYIDMRRLGLDNFTFEILKDGFPDNESMTNYEYEMINKYNSMNDYNILYKVGDRFKTNNQPLNENQLYYYTTFMEKSISKYLNIL